MMGVGPGALVHDATKIGVKAADQRRMMEEALEAIERLLRGETVTMKTDWFTLQDARLQIPCFTRPRLEMAVAAARSPAGALAAGKHGIGMLSIGGTSDEALARHRKNWDLYAETAIANGHVPDRRNWRLVGMFHIADTREQARENVKFGLEAYCKYFSEVATFPILPAGIEDAYDYLTRTGTACIGTPADAIAFVERLVAETGGFGVMAELAHNWADWPQTMRHYELMARFVHPHFQKSTELLKASYDTAFANRPVFNAQSLSAVQAEIDKLAAKKAAQAKDAAE
jgi:limonene 1,2-monooxygenase